MQKFVPLDDATVSDIWTDCILLEVERAIELEELDDVIFVVVDVVLMTHGVHTIVSLET